MTMLTESKKLLAKLMSEEEILVEQGNVKTAFFDTKNRRLMVPTFKDDVSDDVIDLILAHECSHCLYTINEEWMTALDSKKVSKSVLNIVEDFRVETLIKKKYPGLRPIFHRGYAELMKLDFFGLSNLELDELNLADKINLYFKVGFVPGIDFDEEEKAIRDEVEQVVTFDDVVSVATKIQDYLKNNPSKCQTFSDDFFGNAIGGFDDDETELEEESEEELEEESEDELEEELEEAQTDINFNENQSLLFDDSDRISVYVDVPNENMNNYIIDYKDFYRNLKQDCSAIFNDQRTHDEFEVFKKNNAASISYLLKEFRLKKNASIRKKVKESSTGNINGNKLYSYRFNEDIFKKATKVNKEQSHSMIFFLDWSESMTNFINGTIKQLLALILFCKNQNIPYEVYAFSSSRNLYQLSAKRPKKKYDEKEMDFTNFALFNVLSSRMNNVEFSNAANVLLKFKNYSFYGDNGKRYISQTPSWMWLGGTPLNHTIIASRQISESFKIKTKTDIVNNIFLTDGESHSVNFKYFDSYYNYERMFATGDSCINVYIRDKKRGLSQKVGNNTDFAETNSYLNLTKQSSNIRIFGLRIIDRNTLKKRSFSLFGSYDYIKYWNEMKKKNTVKMENNSYDEFYLIGPTTDALIDEDYDISEKKTVNSIAKIFSKSIGNKIDNKVILNKFISFIS